MTGWSCSVWCAQVGGCPLGCQGTADSHWASSWPTPPDHFSQGWSPCALYYSILGVESNKRIGLLLTFVRTKCCISLCVKFLCLNCLNVIFVLSCQFLLVLIGENIFFKGKIKRGTLYFIEMCFLVMGKLNMKIKKALSDDFQPFLSQLILMSGIIPSQIQNPAFVFKVHSIDDAQELVSNN